MRHESVRELVAVDDISSEEDSARRQLVEFAGLPSKVIMATATCAYPGLAPIKASDAAALLNPIPLDVALAQLQHVVSKICEEHPPARARQHWTEQPRPRAQLHHHLRAECQSVTCA